MRKLLYPVTNVRFREGFRQERVKLAEEIERLENELALMKVTSQKEMEYKENMEKSHHSLLVEQRDLQSQSVSSLYLCVFTAGFDVGLARVYSWLQKSKG